jgi:hypothetical protein
MPIRGYASYMQYDLGMQTVQTVIFYALTPDSVTYYHNILR